MGDALVCKIAIIDSGIDLDFYKNHVIKYVEYAEETKVNMIQTDTVRCAVRLCFRLIPLFSLL